MNKSQYDPDIIMKRDYKLGQMDKRPVFKIIMKPRKNCKLQCGHKNDQL